MTGGVTATRAQKRVAESPAGPSTAAATANRNAAAVVRATGTGRRDRPLQNTRLVHYHGFLNGRSKRVPPGTSLIFMCDVGRAMRAVPALAMFTTSDCQRIVVGRMTPGGHRLFIHRYNGGETYPDLDLEKDFQHPCGVFRLPLRPQDVDAYSGISAPSLYRNVDKTTLSAVVRDIGPGKYIVLACREFLDDMPRTLRRRMVEDERAHDEKTLHASYDNASSAESISRGLVTTWKTGQGSKSANDHLARRDDPRTRDTATSMPRGVKFGRIRYPLHRMEEAIERVKRTKGR